MSLYEYDLYLIRELEKGELLSEIINSGFLEDVNDDEALILKQVTCFFGEVINQEVSSCPLRIVKLELDSAQLEQLLKSNAQEFILWLQEIIKMLDPAYVFLGGGSSSSYYEVGGITSEIIFKQIGYLIETGVVEIVHPVMFFSKRIGKGEVCDLAKRSPYAACEIPGLGCLLLLIDNSIEDNQIEILDPGSIYPELRNYFA